MFVLQAGNGGLRSAEETTAVPAPNFVPTPASADPWENMFNASATGGSASGGSAI